MINKAKKWLKEAGTLLFWAVVICMLLALMFFRGMAELGYRWGPGS